MTKQNIPYDLSVNGSEEQPKSSGLDINFKRVASRALNVWYLVLLSVIVALTAAYLVNRYSTPIFPVSASIIIKQSEENVGAKFLYDNSLLNPGRNFYNEIFIMKSYPLLQEVVEELGFDVSYYREGSLKVTEYYDPEFPIKFKRIAGKTLPYGRSLNFKVVNQGEFNLELLFDEEEVSGKKWQNIDFGDTVNINGYGFVVNKTSSVDNIIGKSFQVRFQDPFALARRYSAGLKADYAMLGASVVNLQVTGTVAQKEIAFLNKFIERYQNYDIDKKNRVATMAMKFLDEQILVIRDSLHFYEDQVQDFKSKNIITSLGNETNRLYMKLQELEDRKFQFRLKANYYDYVTKLLKNEQYEGIFTPQSVGINDNVISNLITSLIGIRSAMNAYSGIKNRESNPLFQQQVSQMRQIKSDILQTIENTRKTESINIQFIEESMRVVLHEIAALPASEREFGDIQRNYSLKEKLYVFLIQKRTEAGLSKASTTSDIVVVNPPLAQSAISPKKEQNYMVAGLAGVAIPFIILLLIEISNNRIQSREDIEKLTRIPVIGGVGHNASGDNMVVYNRQRSAMSEAFRALRSNLDYFSSGKSCRILTITSSIPGEGKTFTTLNLASVFALAGKRTLIIGADLRKPKLFDDLKLSNTVGLSQYLSGMVTLDAIVQKSEIDNLYLISGGPMPPNPSELLIRPEMTALIEDLKSKFDFIVIDTPPLAYVSDAVILGRYADHTLYVVRQNYTPRSALQVIEELYSAGKLTNISILFNDLRKSGMGYGYGPGYNYGYGYNYYYGYGRRKSRDTAYYEE